jgi:hypothetical protein
MLKRQNKITKAAEKEAAKAHFTQDDMRDAQRELGVLQNYSPYQRMTEPQIQKAYKRRLKEVHTDKGGTPDQGRRAFAARATLLNICRYDILPK